MTRCRSQLLQRLIVMLAVGAGVVHPVNLAAEAQLVNPGFTTLQQPSTAQLAESLGQRIRRSTYLVVRLGKRRVYVYQGAELKASYPIAVGRAGWETPTGTYQVLNKEKFPIFKSFKTGAIIHPGPENPLGVRWIGIWTNGLTQLGFHGTNEETLIGQAVSHGCIRMRNRDVVALYDQVSVGTLVTVLP